jgi:DNA polymerase-3 subunit epsilon
MGDVELVVDYVELAKGELGEAAILHAVPSLIHGASLPAGLDAGFLDEIPEAPGVYLVYGQNGMPLYIGKSVALRSRCYLISPAVYASIRDMRIGQEITQVEWIETAGELGALLLEAKLIKERQRLHNRKLRARKLFS